MEGKRARATDPSMRQTAAASPWSIALTKAFLQLPMGDWKNPFEMFFWGLGEQSRAEQSRGEQSRGEQSRAEQRRTKEKVPTLSLHQKLSCSNSLGSSCEATAEGCAAVLGWSTMVWYLLG